MKKANIFFLAVLSLLLLYCNDNEPCSDGDPDCPFPVELAGPRDFIVVNEGNFGQANGSLSLVNRGSKSVTNDIVGLSNGGITTGDVVQSVYHDDLYNRIFVVSNNESRILVLDDTSFIQTAVIEEGLSLPRNVIALGDWIYVTNWNSDFTDSFVSKYKRNDLSFWDNNTKTDPGTEQIFSYDGRKIFVSNSFSNTVQVFGDGQFKTINVGYSPIGMTSVYGAYINVICTDTFGGTNGWIYEIDNESLTVTDSVSLGLKPNGQLISDGSKVYFSSGQSIYGFDPRSEFSTSEHRIVNLSGKVSSIYGFSLDPGTSDPNIWVADSKGFNQNGEVHLVDRNSEILESYEVGIGPNGFHFF